MRQWRRLFVLLVTIALVAVACTGTDTSDTTAGANGDGGGSDTSAAVGDGTDTTSAEGNGSDTTAAGASGGFLIATETFTPSAGWAVETDDAFVLTKAGITETLVRVTFDGEIVPWLAESWERRSDEVWAFNLRPGVTFHDGSEFNASAVVDSLNYLLESPTPPRGLTGEIVTTVEAEDDLTVLITTNGADAVLPQRLTGVNTAILSPSAYQPDRTIDPFGGGTGPFVLVDEAPDQWIRVEANPDYWGDAPKLDGAEIQFISEGQTRSSMVQAGDAHIVQQIPITQVPILESDDSLVVLETELPRTTSVYLNNASGPTSEQAVREAINHAIDRELIAASILEGSDQPAIGPFPFWEEWANPDIEEYEYDPSTAQSLLADAGYTEDNPLSLRLWTYIERAELADIAVAIQSMLTQAGVQVDLTISEYASFEADVLAGDYDMFILSRSHLLDVYDPIGFLEADYSCEGGYNLSNYCNEDFDARLAEARALDTGPRYEIYGELAGVLQEQAVDAFLTHQVQIDVHRANVVGYRTHPLNQYMITTDMALEE